MHNPLIQSFNYGYPNVLQIRNASMKVAANRRYRDIIISQNVNILINKK